MLSCKNRIEQLREEVIQLTQEKEAVERQRLEHRLNESELERDHLYREKAKIEDSIRRIERLIEMKRSEKSELDEHKKQLEIEENQIKEEMQQIQQEINTIEQTDS